MEFSLHLLLKILVLVHEEAEFGRQLVLVVVFVAEVDPPDSAIGVNLNSLAFLILRPIRPHHKIRHVELDDVPAVLEGQGHRRYKRLDLGLRVKIGAPDPAAHLLAIHDLHLESEMTLQVFDDQHDEGVSNSQGLLGIRRSR